MIVGKRHLAQRRAGLHRSLLAIALAIAWLGLLPQVISAAARETLASTAPHFRLERPTVPGETCLSRNSREPSNVDSRRADERPGSEPPKSLAATLVWRPQASHPCCVALINAAPAARDHSRTVPPRQPRGPPSQLRA